MCCGCCRDYGLELQRGTTCETDKVAEEDLYGRSGPKQDASLDGHLTKRISTAVDSMVLDCRERVLVEG
jgi:hypothetical protein